MQRTVFTSAELLYQNTQYFDRQPHRIDSQTLYGSEVKWKYEIVRTEGDRTCINATNKQQCQHNR